MEQIDYSLAQIRRSFGFSQEELADRMGRTVSTLSRWERSKTKEPLLSPLVHTANRAYQYVKHMIDPELLRHVESDNGLSGLYYGNEFMIISYSKGNLKRFPLLRATYGFKGAGYLKGAGKRLYDENMDNLNRALATPGSLAVCHTPGQSGIIVTEPFRIEFHFIGNNLAHAISQELATDADIGNPEGSIEYTFG
ncbi:MAG: helix-turn-helix transcriptional regulator [Pseudomonadota bacterium]